MKVIKLDAVDSTNEFMKRLISQQNVVDLTIITAENQTNGKGQMGAKWSSETGKNLIMSILVKDFIFAPHEIFNLNILFSISVLQTLATFKIPKLSVKWPNDIMSDAKKIGGILIENSIKSDGSIYSIVGFGLNVNQTTFENLPKASSLFNACNSYFDKYELLLSISDNLEKNRTLWKKQSELFWMLYTKNLFKIDVPMPFKKQENQLFMGCILGVSPLGKLQVKLENDTISEFYTKEIEMLY